MYENDAAVMNMRPIGLNAIEIQLFICIFTRDYQAELMKHNKLDYRNYILERFCAMFKVPKPKDENDTEIIERRKNLRLMTDAEINALISIGFLHPKTYTLTGKGTMFVLFCQNGGYGYQIPKFDTLYSIYVMITTQVMDSVTENGIEEQEEEGETEEIKLDAEDFVKMFNEVKNKTSKWSKFKDLFRG